MSHEPLIAVDPGGRPIIAGTHVAVADILKALAASEAVDVVLATHPELGRDAVQAALAYAADTMQGREPPPSPTLVQALGAFEPTTPLAKTVMGTPQGGRRGRAGTRRALAPDVG